MKTVCIVHRVVDKCSAITGSGVPLGETATGNTILLVNDDREPVPEGHIGEIAVKSRYLSPGYWKQPDLTANAFLPSKSGERIYCSGDLGRIKSNGDLEYRGRKDFQINLRGYRIELSEIETALLNLKTVSNAVVVLREIRPGNERLVAYFVPTGSSRSSVSELRSDLQGVLPEYMIPSIFMCLESLPLAPNGKVIRQSLPAPDARRPELETSYMAPRTSTEQVLADIWCEVLGLDRVGIDDKFLELGGHSLLAAQIASRVQEHWSTGTSIEALYATPTVAEMATSVMSANASRQNPADLEQLLAEIDSLSEDEAKQMVAEQQRGAETGDGS